MSNYIITYDVGTTGIKTCLFDIKDTIELKASSTEGYNLYVVGGGGAEQDPAEWWNAMCVTTKRIFDKSHVKPEDILGISFCSQMQGLVLVDKDGEPVRRAMSYMDQRAREEIKKGMAYGLQIAGANIFKLLKSLYYTGAVSASVKDPVWKYKWVEAHEPEVFAKVHKWLDVKDFLIGKCTSRLCVTEDSAFGTLMLDIRTRKWSIPICRMLGVNPAHLPEIISSTDCVGGLTAKAAKELGLKEGTKVFGGGGDASLIGVGAGSTALGDTHIYSGTSGWIGTVVDKSMVDTSAMIASIVGAQPGKFTYFARTAQAGSGGVIFTPWLHGNRCPFEDPMSRGMFFNISLETGKTELIRAVLEGVCFHKRWMLEAESRKARTSEVVRFVGGGALSDFTSQLLSDIIGRPVETVANPQNVGAVGAAAVVAVGLGIISSLDNLKDYIPAVKRFTPNPEYKAVYDRNFEVFKALYKSNKANFALLNK